MTVKEILKECAVPYAAIKVKKLINMLETEKDLKFDLRYYTNDGLWYESYGEIAWENPDDSEKPYYFGVKVEGSETKGIFSFKNSELDVNDVIEFLKLKTHEDRLKHIKDNEWDCYNPKKIVATSFSHDYSYDEDVGTNIEFNEKWADVFFEPDYIEESGEINIWEDVDINAITELGDYKQFELLDWEGPEDYDFFLIEISGQDLVIEFSDAS